MKPRDRVVVIARALVLEQARNVTHPDPRRCGDIARIQTLREIADLPGGDGAIAEATAADLALVRAGAFAKERGDDFRGVEVFLSKPPPEDGLAYSSTRPFPGPGDFQAKVVASKTTIVASRVRLSWPGTAADGRNYTVETIFENAAIEIGGTVANERRFRDLFPEDGTAEIVAAAKRGYRAYERALHEGFWNARNWIEASAGPPLETWLPGARTYLIGGGEGGWACKSCGSGGNNPADRLHHERTCFVGVDRIEIELYGRPLTADERRNAMARPQLVAAARATDTVNAIGHALVEALVAEYDRLEIAANRDDNPETYVAESNDATGGGAWYVDAAKAQAFIARGIVAFVHSRIDDFALTDPALTYAAAAATRIQTATLADVRAIEERAQRLEEYREAIERGDVLPKGETLGAVIETGYVDSAAGRRGGVLATNPMLDKGAKFAAERAAAWALRRHQGSATIILRALVSVAPERQGHLVVIFGSNVDGTPNFEDTLLVPFDPGKPPVPTSTP